MRIHVNFNNVSLFCRFCCVNLLFYVICYELFYVSFFRQYFPKSSRCSVCSRVSMCVCSFLCMRLHVSVNNVRPFRRFCCVNLLFYVICYELFYVYFFRQFSPKSSRCSVCSCVFMCVCSFLCMRVHVSVNNVRLFGRFCCVNVLFYVICYELFYVSFSSVFSLIFTVFCMFWCVHVCL